MKPIDQFQNNPRIADDEFLKGLEASMKDLGDLSGVVYNRKSNQLVGGNQRSRVMDINNCEIEVVQKFNKPDRQGTCALGFVVWNGQRFAYREVSWSPEKEKKANIVANAMTARWDIDLLETSFDSDKLLEWGLSPELITWSTDSADDQTDAAEEGSKKSKAKGKDKGSDAKGRKLTATSDGYSSFELIMQYDNKMRLNHALNTVREAHGYDRIELALMHILSVFEGAEAKNAKKKKA